MTVENTIMRDRLKLPFNFDIRRMQQDLSILEQDDWIAHFVEQNYEGDWTILPLRAPAGETHPIRMAYSDPICRDFEDTVFLEKTAYLSEVLQNLPFPLHIVRLMGLSPGSTIKTHIDHDLSLDQGHVRLHIPIRTNKHVSFLLNGREVPMQEGECWYLRLSDPHSVYNGGKEVRVHLVIDAPVSEPLQLAFMQAMEISA
ncbi:MAG: aspartyl/asparaginyl beta-hydroxylase domain-containing protein [bacterium]